MKFPTHTAIFRWRPAAWLRITGADAANFLQGQFTNELRGLAPGRAVYGLWLNVKGKIVADSFVLRGAGAEEFWVGSYFSAAAAIREKLESFIIADDVVIEDETGKWTGVAIVGVGAEATRAGGVGAGFVFEGRRGGGPGCEWVFPMEAAETASAGLAGLRELSAGEMERARIDAAIPAVPADLGAGDLPNEGGLDDVAISYTKGCYLGQEVIARLKSMGQVRRRLLRVRGRVARPASLPAALFVGARQVGEVRSAVSEGADGFVGLAMVTLMHVEAGTGLSFAPDAAAVVHIVDRS